MRRFLASVQSCLPLARGITVRGLVMPRGSAIEVISRYFEREIIGGHAAVPQASAGNEDFADAMLRKILLETVRLRQPYVSAGRETG